MSRIEPQMQYISKESFRAYQTSLFDKPSRYAYVFFKTYRELKKHLKEHLEQNIEERGILVIRSRRGQWGEWNEYWKLDNKGKPYISESFWS